MMRFSVDIYLEDEDYTRSENSLIPEENGHGHLQLGVEFLAKNIEWNCLGAVYLIENRLFSLIASSTVASLDSFKAAERCLELAKIMQQGRGRVLVAIERGGYEKNVKLIKGFGYREGGSDVEAGLIRATSRHVARLMEKSKSDDRHLCFCFGHDFSNIYLLRDPLVISRPT